MKTISSFGDLVTSDNFESFSNLVTAPCQLGIDEAGRGPVLGPMVYGVAVIAVSDVERLKRLGVADSKVLNEEKREQLFSDFNEEKENECPPLAWAVRAISPSEISQAMLRRAKYSLNAVSHDTAIALIDQCIAAGMNIKEVFVDTVGPPETYQMKLAARFPTLTVVVAKKADQLYPVVSAASICAKVTRDRRLRAWTLSEHNDNQLEFGSGYPGDPLTKNFMAGSVEPVFGYPSLVRFSWSTADSILKEKAVAVKWDDDDVDANVPKSKSLRNFFPAKSATDVTAAAPLRRHAFFTDRYLTSVAQL